MKRLVYSPKVYIFIKDQDGEIHDVSSYIVKGTVSRLIDQVSTANITLRNPRALFTTHVEDGVVVFPKFFPMDPITIYLRRIRQRPVRVFTGFLDKAPFLQLFPGTVTFTASCTLKRLVHTYFDPALPYTMSFLVNYGWLPVNGQWVSLTGMQEWLPPGTTPQADGSQTPPIGSTSKNVFLVGDSLSNGTRGPLSKTLSDYNIETNAIDGRDTSSGIAALSAKGKNLPDTVVVALGSNDDPTNIPAFETKVKKVVSIVGSKRHLIWVNLRGNSYSGHDLSALNAVLVQVARENPNMTVVDWKSASSGLNFDNQGIHTDPAGYEKRANLIATAVKTGAVGGGDGNTLQPPKNVDGSLSQLLFATLKHIGQWNPQDIYIEAMPEDLFDRLRDMAQEFENDNKIAQEEFKALLKRIVGSGSQGSPDGSNPTLGGEVQGLDKIIPTIKQIADKYNIDAAMACAVCDIETGYGQNMFTHEPYHGWFQIDIGGSRYSSPISVEQANDLQYSCTLFCKGAAHTVPDSVKGDPLQWAMATQGVNCSNNPLYCSTWNEKYAKAKQYLSQYGDGAASQGLPDQSGLNDPKNTDSSSAPTGDTSGSTQAEATYRSTTKGGTDKSTGGTTRLDAVIAEANRISDLATKKGLPYSNTRPPSDTQGYDCSSSCTALLKAAGYKIDAWPATNTIKAYMKRGEDPTGRLTFWNSDINNTAGNSVHIWAMIKGRPWTTADHLSGHWKDDYYARGNPRSFGFEPYHVDGLDEPASLPADANTSVGGGSGGSTNAIADATSGAGAGAFFASLDLPSMYDAVEASLLTGEKSLLNDKPLLPFVQQLCSASLRHFQSLPDGRFYAFYPDYFGEMLHHPPYWEIDNIEILDGNVDLSDDPLVTHMYVVGDTVAPMGNGDTPFAIRSVWSSGVVTVFNAFMANKMLDRDQSREKQHQQEQRAQKKHDRNSPDNPVGMGILLDRNEAANFLERYGARPVVEDMPMIRSPYYEMFLAYQKFLLAWSKQFSTPFTFTFMPELYPGGKVGFPDHGLQMYIEDVTHSFDYEGGFTTTATLSAPSVYGEHTDLLPPNMVQGIILPSTSKATE